MDIKEIEHLAELSKLEFTKEELEDFKKDFSSLVSLADIIKNSDVVGERKLNTIDMSSLREDIANVSAPVDIILKNAPKKNKDSFIVPRIVD